MRRVLLISGAFFPVANAYAERAYALARLLLSNGFDVDVLTLDALHSVRSNATWQQPHLTVHTVSAGMLGAARANPRLRWLTGGLSILTGFPGPHRIEAHQMFAYYCKHLTTRYYNLSLVTSPPHSLQLVGHWIFKRDRIPHLVDLRDPWAGATRIRHLTVLHRQLSDHWFQRVLNTACGVLANTDGQRRIIEDCAPELPRHRLHTVPSAFDADAFRKAEAEERFQPSQTLRLVYAGGAYGPAMNELFTDLVLACRRRAVPVRIDLYGFTQGDFTCPEIRVRGVLPFDEVPRVLLGADALLLYMPPTAGKTPTMSLKAYNYARAGRPVLYFGPHNQTYDYLRNNSVVHPVTTDLDATAQWLLTDLRRITMPCSSALQLDSQDSWTARAPSFMASVISCIGC